MTKASSDRPAAIPTVQHEDDGVVVTEWHFPPGAETGWHVHGLDYVVVPMTTGDLTIELPDGSTVTSPLTKGQSYARGAGVDHNVINGNDFPFTFVEVEVKR